MMDLTKKRVTHPVIIVVLVSMLMILAYGDVFASSKSLSITKYSQEKSNWCWAAGAQMVAKYKVPASTKTQSNIVSHCHGNTNNTPGTLADIKSAITYASNSYYFGHSQTVIDYSTHMSKLNASMPVLAWMSWNGGGAHILVVKAYNFTNLITLLTLIDPIANRATTTYNYLSLVTGCTVQSGTGTYTHSIWIYY
jgi:hypothetical protein